MTKRTLLTALTLLALLPCVTQAEIVPLTSLDPTAAKDRGGKNPLEVEDDQKKKLFVDKAPEKEELAIGERQFERGFYFVEMKQSLDYALDGQYSGFVAEVGVRKKGPASFDVLGDGEYLYESGPIADGEKRSVVLDVSEVQTLTIVINRLDDLWTHAVVGDPYLIKKPEVPEATAGNAGNTAPEAKISAEPLEGRAPLTVAFDGSDSTDAEDAVYRYTWHFGDGQTENLAPNPTHTYEQPGVYQAVLLAADNDGGVGVARQLIKVFPVENQPPKAAITASTRLAEPPAEITFSAESSFDRDGKIVAYRWEFADGTTAEGPEVTRKYTETGFGTATLTVEDNGGATDTAGLRVRLDDGSNSTVFPVREGSRILFINNSLLWFNGSAGEFIPQIAATDDPPFELVIEQTGKGAGKVEEYVTWPSLKIQDHINKGWDMVILQPWTEMNSREPEKDFYPHVRTLVEWIRESGAVPLLYEPQMGWKTFPNAQPQVRERLDTIADELDVEVIHAGKVWELMLAQHPEERDERGNLVKNEDNPGFVTLLYRDGVHQNAVGAMMNNYILYKYLTGRSPIGLVPTDWGWKMEETIDEVNAAFPDLPGGALRYVQEVADRNIEPHPAVVVEQQ